MASIGVIFTSTYHTKQLNPWPNSSASRVVNYSQLSACQGDMQPFEGDPHTCGRLTSLRTSHSKSSPGNFQHQYLAELLVNMYGYCLMVKSVSCCCVRGSRLFSYLVTHIDIDIDIEASHLSMMLPRGEVTLSCCHRRGRVVVQRCLDKS